MSETNGDKPKDDENHTETDKPQEGDQPQEGQTDANAPPAAHRAAVPHQLRPGDPGYAPPARIAPETGVLTTEHLGWNPGRDAAITASGEVPLAMPAPAPASLENDPGMSPSNLSAAAARVQLRAKIGALMLWIHDLPHEVYGEEAVVVAFFRDLLGRRKARGTAATLGRSIEEDEVDQAQAAPPGEFFELRHLAQSVKTMREIYDGELASQGVTLSGDAMSKIDRITSQFDRYMEGPTEPPPDDEEDEEPPAPVPSETKEPVAA